jgi:methylenetetrahydrofolate dehydrogenase (NADP+)/methenyltetrahydrofolate cyclohydrolase
MSAKLVDGTAIAAQIRQETAEAVLRLKQEHGIVPGLATVLVGENPASKAYVGSKQRACEELGMVSLGRKLSGDAAQAEVEQVVRELNADPNVHGILVQLPLPRHLDEEKILSMISLEKDVDGFHPVNIGRLSMKGREPLFVPCTPAGCVELLVRSGVKIGGQEAVVLGRSNIVGLPVAMLLLHRDATITICHSRTQDLAATCRRADILIAAVGRAEMVKGNWVKPGAAVIDVGINQVWRDHPADRDYTSAVSGKTFLAHLEAESDKGGRRKIGEYCSECGMAWMNDEDAPESCTGCGGKYVSLFRKYELVGDVDFDEVKEVAGHLTPVPGGVGPMTIAMLMHNTYRGAVHSLK